MRCSRGVHCLYDATTAAPGRKEHGLFRTPVVDPSFTWQTAWSLRDLSGPALASAPILALLLVLSLLQGRNVRPPTVQGSWRLG